jgi:hypothetical protein
MKTVKITRILSDDMGTFGRLSVDKLRLYTGELPWRNNARKLSCIPAGEYNIQLINSPHFGKVYLVKDVPNRSMVEMHSANFMGDSRYCDTQLEGCIALGEKIGAMRNSKGVMQRAILISRPAVRKFMAALNGDNAKLIIEDRT